MSKIYIQACEADRTFMASVVRSFHDRLIQANVSIAFTMARQFDAQEQPVHCVKFAGANAAAVTRKIQPRRRVYDPHDVEIEVDGLTWDELSPQGRTALLDHELNHIHLVVDEAGAVRVDDMNRPKIKLIPDDFLLTGFFGVVSRHREHALEWLSVQRVQRELLLIINGPVAGGEDPGDGGTDGPTDPREDTDEPAVRDEGVGVVEAAPPPRARRRTSRAEEVVA